MKAALSPFLHLGQLHYNIMSLIGHSTTWVLWALCIALTRVAAEFKSATYRFRVYLTEVKKNNPFKQKGNRLIKWLTCLWSSCSLLMGSFKFLFYFLMVLYLQSGYEPFKLKNGLLYRNPLQASSQPGSLILLQYAIPFFFFSSMAAKHVQSSLGWSLEIL